MTVAALFVSQKGPYFGRPDVDPWAFADALLELARHSKGGAR